MAHYTTELLEQLNGARMVVTEQCEQCEVFAIAYWNGEATVNYALLSRGDVPQEDAWTNFDLKSRTPQTIELTIREQLVKDMCKCLGKGRA